MAQSREDSHGPSSPHSSNGPPESFKGTPDPRATGLSPNHTSKSAELLRSVTRSSSATSPVRFPVNSYDSSFSPLGADPFVTPGRGKRLSPTASTFKPLPKTSLSPHYSEAGTVSTGLSTDLGLSRLLDISYPVSLTAPEVKAWLLDLEKQGIQMHGESSIKPASGHIFIHFDDIRDACSVHASSRLSRKDWKLEFANSAELARDEMVHSAAQPLSSGQVVVFAVLRADSIAIDVLDAVEIIKDSIQKYGRLFAFVRLSTFPDGSFRAVAEFCNTTSALGAVTAVANSPMVEGIHLTLSLHSSDLAAAQGLASALQGVSFNNVCDEPVRQRTAPHVVTPRAASASRVSFQSTFPMYPLMFQAPFSPGMPYVVDGLSNTGQRSPITPASPGYSTMGPFYQAPPSPALTPYNNQSPSRALSNYGRPDVRRQNATRINRSPHHNATSHHNHVDIHRIREGTDVRTTIMLRNIPNKVDQAMLKRIIDESSWGKYDFMYLRIDFANDCNVGYAFINFVDPLDIIDFVDARGNQRWNCFKSDKVAEVSYATIQGKDCLVQKFRNSSVMLEAPHYRPKLYFTSNGPMPELAGQEEPFPEPDNQSKMKRSCENAEHVGLFTPNAGQHFRDEQRRRRSQYDRGTRLAALEEYDYETAVHHMYAPPGE